MPSRRSLLQENEGCLLHLPLSFDGDLSDRITGNALELSGNGSLTWDATEGMYKVIQPSATGQWVARIKIDLSANRFPDNSWTCIGQIKKISSSGTKHSSFMGNSSSVGYWVTRLGYNGTANVVVFPTEIVKAANVVDNANNLKLSYQQESLYSSTAITSAALPSNWNLGTNAYMYIGYNEGSTFYGTQYYVKDFYFFNRVLTAEEIYKIQGY